MKNKNLVAATHYFNRSRWDVINQLSADNVGWEFAIGVKPLRDPEFKSEFPEFEIIAEYWPSFRERKSRYAIYAKQFAFWRRHEKC